MNSNEVNPVVAAAIAVFATFIYPPAVRGDGGTLLESLLRPNPICAPVLSADKHEVQILYTQIDRDADNRPHFTRHEYRVNPQDYFYPASAIKLAGALLALEKLNQLGMAGVDRHTPVRIDSAASGQTAVREDPTAPNGLPTIAHYIRKLFAISDNDAYNRLYEFVGQQRLNEGLWEKGYRDVRLTHRLAIVRSPEENRHTNPLAFYRGDQVLYRQPMLVNPHTWRAPAPIPKGEGHIQNGELVAAPKDFAGSNYMSVEVLQDLLMAVFFPEELPAERRFDLRPDAYRFLYRAMSMLPRECPHPQYDPKKYYDSYVKFFLFGDNKKPMPDSVRIFNKVGLAYGYVTDNAYIVDFERGVEFLLTAVVLVNENGIFNDGTYEYDEVGLPFLSELGRAIYAYELERKREYRPDLSKWRVNYGP
ncbi:MAG: serine hydrolase [Gemmatimonadetes bacterium]|nr:serine hydrolase [Gemmatimonadota bacterium]